MFLLPNQIKQENLLLAAGEQELRFVGFEVREELVYFVENISRKVLNDSKILHTNESSLNLISNSPHKTN